MVDMKPKKTKAQRYWSRPDSLKLYGTKTTAQYYSGFAANNVAPVYVLPADAASVDRMVEQVMIAITTRKNKAESHTHRDLARAALAAIGIGGAK